jgi:hypothetical protein
VGEQFQQKVGVPEALVFHKEVVRAADVAPCALHIGADERHHGARILGFGEGDRDGGEKILVMGFGERNQHIAALLGAEREERLDPGPAEAAARGAAERRESFEGARLVRVAENFGDRRHRIEHVGGGLQLLRVMIEVVEEEYRELRLEDAVAGERPQRALAELPFLAQRDPN